MRESHYVLCLVSHLYSNKLTSVKGFWQKNAHLDKVRIFAFKDQ